ncbi:hypothetical protein [Qipengyuania sp.]|uniref:hypothetical protein n=1 Tax=Qipengyuania sp. TaxID=2004515 RepID=UPI0037359A0B
MGDLTRDSDRLIETGRILRDDNRAGGRHRRGGKSIGSHSARARRKNLMARLRNVLIALFTIWVGAGIAGAFVSGIGFFGVMAVLLASVIAIAVFASFPKVKQPKRADLNKGDVGQMVTRTELWLEAQRPALPPPAVTLVDQIGVQLDGLSAQLQHVDQNHPKAREVRSLVGEQLPEMIDAYRRIPPHLQREERGGSTPAQQLEKSLGTISGEIDSITRQLAEGSLDDLAIRHRFLDYKFGAAQDGAPALKGPE